MYGLPNLPRADGIQKMSTIKFGGYNHTLGAGDGEIWDEQNMTSDYYPVMSPRRPRYTVKSSISSPNGLFCKDGIYYVSGTKLYKNGTVTGLTSLTNTRKKITALGAYIVIFPDKAYYNVLDDSYGSLESSVANQSVTIKDGTYAGETAEANTIYASGVTWGNYFKVGDAVTISGCTTHTENNTTIVIREIDGADLRFYENSFVIGTGGDSETITISRTVPDMDFICENENRLWGCKDDTIYASKLGDPFNFNVFDGISTDSYAANVGSAGEFTACCSYLGYPVFFKEENIYKVYGNKPSNYQIMGSASLGVEKGSDRSLAIAGEILFYLSRAGIVAYSGGIPQSVAAPFGTDRYKNAIGGSDGVKYYVSMQGTSGYTLFVFDTRTNLWHKEDGTEAVGFGWDGELYMLTTETTLFLGAIGDLLLIGNPRTIPTGATREGSVSSIVEFADFVEHSKYSTRHGANKKGTGKIQLRGELDAGASLNIKMKFDSGGDWIDVATLTTTVKRSFYLPIIPRRSDHFKIKLIGTGNWKLWSLSRESYFGSEL
ncbi:MAG: hypothetical protein IK093_09735 [Ruminiclostridium sp.]|nr:hypothetical protein [Ruminiclostridium sp.]